jgi:hypothetical protein
MIDQRYQSGEEIHIGDRVQYAGFPATISLVIDRDEWPDEESAESRAWWRSEHRSGFLLAQHTMGRVFLPEADEDLIFVSHAATFAP